MSRIRRKSEAVLDRGRQDRDTWSPQLGSAPLRHYMWWRQQTGKYRAQENFCHFWRVVLIWAPLLRLRKANPFKGRSVDWKLVGIACCVLAAYALVVSLTWDAFSWWSLLIAPVVMLLWSGVIVGFSTLLDLLGGKLRSARANRRIHRRTTVRQEDTFEIVGAVASEDAKRPRKRLRDTRLYVALSRVARPVARFLSSCADYVVLLAQVIRVKKWKICPIVEIPDRL